MKKQPKKSEQQQAIESLREILKPGDTVYTVLRHVSQSGMSRRIDCYVMENNEPRRISYYVAKACDYSLSRGNKEGIFVSGCGMDMGFHLVYSLSRRLFPNGFGERGTLPMGHEITPKSKEHAAECVAKGASFRGRNGDTSGWDNDGGYALKQSWM